MAMLKARKRVHNRNEIVRSASKAPRHQVIHTVCPVINSLGKSAGLSPPYGLRRSVVA